MQTLTSQTGKCTPELGGWGACGPGSQPSGLSPACLLAGAREGGSHLGLLGSSVLPCSAPCMLLCSVHAAGMRALLSSQLHPPSSSLKPHQLVEPGFQPELCCEAWPGPFPTLVLDGYFQSVSGPQVGPTATLFFLGSPAPSPATGQQLHECWAYTACPTGLTAQMGAECGAGDTGSQEPSPQLPGPRGSWCELARLTGRGCPSPAPCSACSWRFQLYP